MSGRLEWTTPAVALMEMRERADAEEVRIVELFGQLTEAEQREFLLRAVLKCLGWIAHLKSSEGRAST